MPRARGWRGAGPADKAGRMQLGFETIGNACILCHDHGPVLVTDPWLDGPAYFGSWILSHRVPQEQLANARACRFVWLSHGHPDHLSLPSLELLRDKPILLPDHRGGRIAQDLRQLGFQVTVLQDGVWTELSPRLRVASLANYNQDAVLLIDLDGNLIVDANDAGDRGAGRFLQRELPRFRRSFLACLMGYGDADMIHFVDEQGRPVPPAAAAREPLGPQIAAILHGYGIGYYAPSSSQHRYQRTDSLWANEHITPVDDYQRGFRSDRGAQCLPAFVQFDLESGEHRRIDPPSNAGITAPPEQFGDDWSTPLEAADVAVLRDYFCQFEHLRRCLDFVNFRVGGRDHTIDVGRGHRRGITFATPRQSLLAAVQWRAFDDLLIGNFTRTTLHGDWGAIGAAALYPDFTPFVTKFGDNGGARTAAELRAYFADYLARGFTAFGPAPADQQMLRALQPYL